MEPVDPCVPLHLLPEGSRAIVIAEKQDEYLDLPSVRTPVGQVVTRWTLTDEERHAIACGSDLYITILAHGAINPIMPTVGPIDWNEHAEQLRNGG